MKTVAVLGGRARRERRCARICRFLVGWLLLLEASMSSADPFEQFFDGERRGLVVSAGGGLLPIMTLSSRDARPSISESAGGLSLGGLAGIGLTDTDVIGFEGQVVFTSQMKAHQWQSFAGGTWLHYFGPSDRSMFGGLGVGAIRRSTYTYSCGVLGPEPCPAVMPPQGNGVAARLELGYQSRKFQIMGHGLLGRVRDEGQGLDFRVGEFGVEVQGIRY